MRLHASVTFTPIDVRTLRATFPALADLWRATRFEQGAVVTPDGTRKGGVTVVAGTHPQPGTRYRIETQGPHEVATSFVDVVADDMRAVRLRLEQSDGAVVTTIDVRGPLDPTDVAVDGVIATTAPWPVGGTTTLHADVVLTDPHVQVDVRHPRLQAAADVALDEQSASATITLRLGLRGLFRPLGTLGLFFARPFLQRRLDAAMASLASAVDNFNRSVADHGGANALARQVLTDFLNEVRS